MANVTLKDGAAADFTYANNPNGQAARAASKPVTLATEDAALLDGIEATLTAIDGRVDGLETLITASNALLTTIDASLNDIEAAAEDTTTASPVKPGAREHETVAASQTDQMLGASGAAGDVLDGLLVIPATTSPGAVSIEYGSTNITVFAGGTDSVGDLRPFWIELGSIASVGGGWEITTGANVSVIATGDFT
ncbi:MAG: hypothetical protein V4696_08180 [Pseudomonadota bacterium]